MEPSSGRHQHNPRCLKYRAYGAERKERKGRGGIKKRKWAKKRNDVESWQLSHGTRLWEKEEKKGKSSTKSLEENWLSEYNNLRVAGRAKQDSTFFFFSVRACFSLSQGRALHTARSFSLFFPFSLRAINRRPPLPSEEEEKENYSIYYSVCARDVAHTLYTC